MVTAAELKAAKAAEEAKTAEQHRNNPRDFLTIAEAESILGADFADDSDKARLIKLANTWMRNEVGTVPDPIDPPLKRCCM